MKRIFTWEEILQSDELKTISNTMKGAGISIGCFDGFHLGHQKLVKNLVKKCKEKNLVPVLFSINTMHKPGVKGFNISRKDNFEIDLESLGIEYIVKIDLTPDFARMTGEEFFSLLIDKINLKFVTEGIDFRCGYKGAMDVKKISDFCEENFIDCSFVKPVILEEFKESRISSTLIRNLIEKGDISTAVKMLGHSFILEFSPKKDLVYSREELNQVVPKEGLFTGKNEKNEPVTIEIKQDMVILNKASSIICLD